MDMATALTTEVVKALTPGFAKPLSLTSIAEQVQRKKEEKENPPPKPVPQVIQVQEPAPPPEPEDMEAEEAKALQHAGANSFSVLSASLRQT